MSENLSQLAHQTKQKAKALGFDLVGIAPAHPSQYRDYFRRWLAEGKAGAMDYLPARFDERTDPAAYLSGASSVICVAMNYFVPLKEPPPGNQARIARYALGDDYHEIIKPRLHLLADWLREQHPETKTRCAVDTAPVMEKELASRCGIGWIGKNTCLINPQIGSWLLLGEIITTLALPTDEPESDHCGTCRRCLDACPTQAITAPYELDATKCISYLTIEHDALLPPDLHNLLGDWIYGCDICQDVCPFNRRAIPTLEPRLQPRFESGTLPLSEIANWQAEDYRSRLIHSAMKRVKLPVLQRNARIISANNAQSPGVNPGFEKN